MCITHVLVTYVLHMYCAGYTPLLHLQLFICNTCVGQTPREGTPVLGHGPRDGTTILGHGREVRQ